MGEIDLGKEKDRDEKHDRNARKGHSSIGKARDSSARTTAAATKTAKTEKIICRRKIPPFPCGQFIRPAKRQPAHRHQQQRKRTIDQGIRFKPEAVESS